MNSKLALSAVIVTALALNGCSSFNNAIGSWGSNLSNRPANVVCYSGGKEVYRTTTTGKVTTGNGDMASFWDNNGNFVEAFADCIYTYDVKPSSKAP